VAAKWTAASDPVADVHYLLVMARLRGARPPDVTRRTAEAALALLGKVAPLRERLQNWESRLSEALEELARRDAELGPSIAAHEGALAPDAVPLYAALPLADRRRLARRFAPQLAAGKVAWQPSLVRLVADLPPAEAKPLLRAQVDNAAVRDAVLLALARTPDPGDRARYEAGLASFQPTVYDHCLAALERLPPASGADTEIALLRLLRRLLSEPVARHVRARVLALVEKEAGRRFAVDEGKANTRAALEKAYRAVFDWFATAHREHLAQLGNEGEEDPAAWETRLRTVPWDRGDARRGEDLVKQRACLACHAGQRTLGPSLAGAASRMSREDLFAAIAFPNRDISPTYRPLVVETKAGEIYTGTVVYTGPDILILQTGPSTTVRLASADLASKRPSDTSLMPSGLLEGLSAQAIADMYSYLRTLH
jgi:putative heme-binding domain-containing protein